MRDILFRGKRIDNGEWVEGFLFPQNIDSGYCPLCICSSPISANDYSEILGDWSIVSEDTIGQYTGLTDKNGKKIFEGDVLSATLDCAIGIVMFGNYCNPFNLNGVDCNYGFYIDWQGRENECLRKYIGYWSKRSDVEVIGNIHDNPELIEVNE